MGIRREEEMEMSDDDSDQNPCKRMRTGENGRRERRPVSTLSGDWFLFHVAVATSSPVLLQEVTIRLRRL